MINKVLMIATVPSMIGSFNMSNIEILQKKEIKVEVACNFKDRSVWNSKSIEKFQRKLKKIGVETIQIDFPRNPLKLKQVNKAYKQLKILLSERKYLFVHTHTPIASAIVRLVVKELKKEDIKIVYTAHGFHFHKKSQKRDWILYYPIEKWLSKYTYMIITINNEDFKIAEKFSALKKRYIPGVGVDINKIANIKININNKKNSLNLPENSKVVLSIGEISDRKNHQVIISAIARLKRKEIYYLICGRGESKNKLLKLSKKLKLSKNVKFLGFRDDVGELCHLADVGAFPSKIEGLGFAGIEILSAGTPLVSSNIHGINDYSIDGVTGYTNSPKDVNGFAEAIKKILDNKENAKKMGEKGQEIVKKFSKENSIKAMKEIYKEILSDCGFKV